MEHAIYEWRTGTLETKPFTDDQIPAPGVERARVRYERHLARIIEWQNLSRDLTQQTLTRWMRAIQYVLIQACHASDA